MEEGKNSFVFYKSYYEAIKELDKDSQYKIYNAIIQYALYGNEPKNDTNIDTKLDANLIPIFVLIKPNIDSANNRYNASVSNGKKGGRPKKNLEKPRQNLNEDEDVDDDIYKHFEKIWETYPVKKGKQKAESYFLSWIKGRRINGKILRLTDKEMWYAVQTYLKELEETKKDLEFVPHGSTFFNTKIYDYYEIWKEKN